MPIAALVVSLLYPFSHNRLRKLISNQKKKKGKSLKRCSLFISLYHVLICCFSVENVDCCAEMLSVFLMKVVPYVQLQVSDTAYASQQPFMYVM